MGSDTIFTSWSFLLQVFQSTLPQVSVHALIIHNLSSRRPWQGGVIESPRPRRKPFTKGNIYATLKIQGSRILMLHSACLQTDTTDDTEGKKP